jgi:hypothetical protein
MGRLQAVWGAGRRAELRDTADIIEACEAERWPEAAEPRRKA